MFSRNEPQFSNPDDGDLPRLSADQWAEELLMPAVQFFSELLPEKGLRAVRDAVQVVDSSSARDPYARSAIRTGAAAILDCFELYEDAAEYLSQAIQIEATASSAPSQELACQQVWRGELLCRLGRLVDAESAASLGLEWISALDRNSPLEVRAKLALAAIYRARQDHGRFGTTMSAVFSDLQDIPAESQAELSDVLESTARQWAKEGSFKDALALAQMAESICEEIPSVGRADYWTLRAFVGEIMHKIGQFDCARKVREGILEELVADPDAGPLDSDTIQASCVLAETLLELNQFERAERILSDALERAKEADDPQSASMCFDLLTVQYVSRGMEAEAEALRESVADILEELSLGTRILRRVDGELLELAMEGQEGAALEQLDELMAEAARLEEGERRYVELCLLAAKALMVVGSSPEEAREILDEVFERSLALPDSYVESVKMRASMVEEILARQADDPERAIELAEHQLSELNRVEGESRSRLRIRMLQSLAITQSSAGRDEDAVETARRAIEVHERHNDVRSLMFAESLMILARLLPKGDEEAKKLNEKASEIRERYGS